MMETVVGSLEKIISKCILSEIKDNHIGENETKSFALDLGGGEQMNSVYACNFIDKVISESYLELGYEIAFKDVLVTSVKEVRKFNKKLSDLYLGQYENRSEKSFVYLRNNINTEEISQNLIIYIYNGEYPDLQSLKDVNSISTRVLEKYLINNSDPGIIDELFDTQKCLA